MLQEEEGAEDPERLRKTPCAPSRPPASRWICLCLDRPYGEQMEEQSPAGTWSVVTCPVLPEQLRLSETSPWNREERCPSLLPRLPDLRLAALSLCQYFDTKHRGVCVLSLVK